MGKSTVQYAWRRGKAGKQNNGFTLLEVLIAVAILVVLLGLALVGVVRWRDYLKITELDNAAREIYMAAENRAVLMQNSGASAVLLSSGPSPASDESLVVLSKKTVEPDSMDVRLEELLPVGTIDPALREKCYYILYSKSTGHVTDVFYAEKNTISDVDELLSIKTDRDARMKLAAMTGWYGGDAGEKIDTKFLPTPGVEVMIENGEELTLTVRYTLPDGLPEGVTYDPRVVLKYKDQMEIELLRKSGNTSLLEFPNGGGQVREGLSTDFSNGSIESTVEFIWALDSLQKDSQFRNLSPILQDLGGDFTVTAGLTLTAPGWIESSYYAQDTDNSLFDTASTSDTAMIANLRHLQNLCKTSSIFTSEVSGDIKKAEQLCDIDCGKYLGTDYAFAPIVNDGLTSYNGRNRHIISLATVTGVDAAGLFGTVSSDLEIRDTRVCWKESDQLVSGGNYRYAVRGTNAGGLIGSVTQGEVIIQNSYAATTVQGASNAGGLVGAVSGGSLSIRNSYADCYLNAGVNAGGLTGSGNIYILENSYAAGFITAGENTYGLAGGSVTTAPANCYSAVRVINGVRLERPGKPLAEGLTDNGVNVRYVYMAADVEAGAFGGAFGGRPETHPYDLRYKLSNNAVDELKPPYPFPGLTGLPHYGDWAELNVNPVPAGLAYYEIYYDGTSGAEGFYENHSKYATLKKDTDNPVVIRDGYALMFEGDTVPASACTVTYGAQEWTLTGSVWTLTVAAGQQPVTQTVAPIAAEGYILIPLPDAVVTDSLADSGTFFQKLDYQGKLDGTDTEKEESRRSFYFNPHFARTVTAGTVTVQTTGATKNVTYEAPMKPGEPVSESRPVYIRTARHLYDLSVFQTAGYNYAEKKLYFRQELDIDYAAYTGYAETEYPGSLAPGENILFGQDPIGFGTSADSPGDPFLGIYDGGCHMIQNVFFRSKGNYLGLFGLFGKDSVLKNVVYEMNPAQTQAVAESSLAAGALTGKNYGTIENCAVYGVNMSLAGRYIGGLVGYNQGTVKNCAAEVASLTVRLSDNGNSCAGGLAGSQQGGNTISNCYAVGRLVRSGDNGIVAGLVGSGGVVQNSYAAVDLVSDGDRYGLCGNNTTVQDSGWLKDVFVYRGTKYNITATTDYMDPGRAFTFTELAKKLSAPQAAAGITVRNIPPAVDYTSSYAGKVFPYRTGVRTTLNRDPDTGAISGTTGSTPIHYGLWPVPLPVGLAYYETYSGSGTVGVSGQYENEKIMTLKKDTDNPVAARDGYALVFEGDIPVGAYTVRYGNTGQQSWTLNKTSDGLYTWSGFGAVQQIEPIEADGYTLVPLPDRIVTGALPEGDVVSAKFYQKLVYGQGLFSERTFYFNPHFAGRIKASELVSVEAGSVAPNTAYTAPGVPAEPVNNADGITVWTATCEDIDQKWNQKNNHVISVRTARHFYGLSRFQRTYVVEKDPANPDKRYYFRQELDLDYGSYNWYGSEMPTKPTGKEYYQQVPIGQGTGDDGFKGAYNGGGHRIKNVFYTTKKAGDYQVSAASLYIGLFRYAEYLWNINYEVPAGAAVSPKNDIATSGNSSDLINGIKVGTLMGGCFRAADCTAVLLGDFTVTCGGKHVFIGGLAGYSNKMNNCHAEIKGCLRFNGTAETVYVGGLQGIVYQEVVNSTSKVSSLVVEGGTTIYAGGLLGGIARDSVSMTTRAVAGCATEIKDLRVTAGGTGYAGGLIGYNCVGGSIYASYAVGAIGAGDTNTNHHYSGFAGRNANITDGGITYQFAIKNCYSAVGLPGGSANRNYNFCPGSPGTAGNFSNCYYLTGTWKYGGKQYTALSTTSYATGRSYNQLKTAWGLLQPCQYKYRYSPGWGNDRGIIYDIPGMRAGGATGYPFPTGDGRIRVRLGVYSGSTFISNNDYELILRPYPGDDWPKP